MSVSIEQWQIDLAARDADEKAAVRLTMRDYFASRFMAAMLSRPDSTVSIDGPKSAPIGFQQAQTAYALADAMLLARVI